MLSPRAHLPLATSLTVRRHVSEATFCSKCGIEDGSRPDRPGGILQTPANEPGVVSQYFRHIREYIIRDVAPRGLSVSVEGPRASQHRASFLAMNETVFLLPYTSLRVRNALQRRCTKRPRVHTTPESRELDATCSFQARATIFEWGEAGYCALEGWPRAPNAAAEWPAPAGHARPLRAKLKKFLAHRPRRSLACGTHDKNFEGRLF